MAQSPCVTSSSPWGRWSLAILLSAPQASIPITPYGHVDMRLEHLCSRDFPCLITCKDPIHSQGNVEVNCRQVPASQTIHLLLCSSKAWSERIPFVSLCKLVWWKTCATQWLNYASIRCNELPLVHFWWPLTQRKAQDATLHPRSPSTKYAQRSVLSLGSTTRLWSINNRCR